MSPFRCDTFENENEIFKMVKKLQSKVQEHMKQPDNFSPVDNVIVKKIKHSKKQKIK